MRITVHVRTSCDSARLPAPEDRDVRAAREPYHDAPYVLVAGACPECKATNDGEFELYGGRIRYSDDREQLCDAVCKHCNEHIGALRAEFSTLFGREEDRRVLQGRPRVY